MPKYRHADAIKYVSAAAQRLDPDPAHSEHVTFLALQLFDGLTPLHGLGRRERDLLEIAGRLHDIGWSASTDAPGRHHKESGRLIRGLEIPGLAESETVACSLIARYHTKALPDAKRHKTFASLGQEMREIVEWLAGILRVADGLDCLHDKKIRKISCEAGRRSIRLTLKVSGGDCRMEIDKAVQKEGLLVRKMKKGIKYIC